MLFTSALGQIVKVEPVVRGLEAQKIHFTTEGVLCSIYTKWEYNLLEATIFIEQHCTIRSLDKICHVNLVPRKLKIILFLTSLYIGGK